MVNVIKKYLDLTKFSAQKQIFEDLFLSHPNFPSLYAITDTLNLLSIDNLAVKVQLDQFFELPEMFLTFFNEEIVLLLKDGNNVILEKNNGQKGTLTTKHFLDSWEGIVIAVEPNIEKEQQKTSSKQKWVTYFLPVLVLLFLSVLFNNFIVTQIIFLITSLTGLIVSVLIIQEKFGVQNAFVSKFCKIGNSTSCDMVIQSNESNNNQWINFWDIPIVFFFINLISLLLFPNVLDIIGFLSMASFPIILYSLWIQKFKIKKWCVLCLLISFIIVLQAFLYVIFFNFDFIFNYSNLYFYLLSTIITVTLWQFIKPYLETKVKLEKENIALKKFKRNFDIFDYLAKDIQSIDDFNKLEGIQFGNPNAQAKLTIFVSPSCSHCHDAVAEALELVAQFPEKISFHLLFNLNTDNQDNPYTIVAKLILEINYTNPARVSEAVNDWHIKRMTLKQWLDKWQTNTLNMKVSHQMLVQYNWCEKNEFNYTPVALINNKIVPNEYQTSELKYFITHFSEPDNITDNKLIEA